MVTTMMSVENNVSFLLVCGLQKILKIFIK
jgi:hypothetical protein